MEIPLGGSPRSQMDGTLATPTTMTRTRAPQWPGVSHCQLHLAAGGGGKFTQPLHHQENVDYYKRLTGRDPPQKTSEWVTWASHTTQAAPAGALAGVSRGGFVQAVSPSDNIGGCGKRGRNVAIDEAMSHRGGETQFAPLRQGQEDLYHDPKVSGWFSPSAHNREAHNPMAVRQPAGGGAMAGDQGVTNLGGGKRGRNPVKEYHMATAGSEAFISPQAKPQMGKWGTQTGGGTKGRSPSKDAAMSSNDGRLW